MRSPVGAQLRSFAGTPPRRVIIGPTAGGKSALAMALAEHYRLAIISADSRQVYAGFDIGTAKPSARERARVPHYGVDIIEPSVRYSAHRWATEAQTWICDATERGYEPVVVGGTGFYVRALVDPLRSLVPEDPVARVALERWLATMSSEEVRRWCRRLDPTRAVLGRTQQLRAIETALLTGQRLSGAFHPIVAAPTAGFTAPPTAITHYLVVDPGPALAARIADRVRGMIEGGWVAEIERLVATVPADAPVWGASGYRALRDAVVTGAPLDAAVQRVLIETRQYAKRQRTWYRHQLPAAQVTHVDSGAGDALEQARVWWESVDERSS